MTLTLSVCREEQKQKHGSGADAETVGWLHKVLVSGGKEQENGGITDGFVLFLVFLVSLIFIYCWAGFAFLFCLFCSWFCFLVVALGVRRGFWMVSFCSFSSCKMRATQILLLKWCLYSLKILRSFSMISPELCEDPRSFLFFVSFFPFHPVFFSLGLCGAHVLLLDTLRGAWKFVLCSWSSPLFLSLHREQPSVDFKRVDAHVHQFKGSSSRYTHKFCFSLHWEKHGMK